MHPQAPHPEGVIAPERCSDAEQHTSDPPLRAAAGAVCQTGNRDRSRPGRRHVVPSFEFLESIIRNAPLSEQGFLETISEVQPKQQLYVFRLLNTSKSACDVRFSPCRADALGTRRGFVPCNLRRAGGGGFKAKFVNCAGVFSCWSSLTSQEVVVAYSDAAAVVAWFVEWGISHEDHNKLVKIMNGNGCEICGVAGKRLCDTCAVATFGPGTALSEREARRRGREDAATVVVENKTCACGVKFDVTRQMMDKMANHKSKGNYYGFDKCESCRKNSIQFEAALAEIQPGQPIATIVVPPPAATPPKPKIRDAFVPISTKTSSAPSAAKSDAPEEPTYESDFLRLLEQSIALGLPRGSDVPTRVPTLWVLAGHLKPGDYILAREFTEPFARAVDDPILRLLSKDGYFRTGKRMCDVTIDGVPFTSNDWLFDPKPVAWVGAKCLRARQIGFKEVEGVAMGLFEITETREELAPVRHRFSDFHYKRRHYAAFRGSTISEIKIDGRRLYVPSQVLGETLRYFSGEANARVSASYIMGELKRNNKLSAEQIDYIVRFACAHHDSRAVHFAEAISGDRRTTDRVADEMAQTKHAWWLPTFMVRFRCDLDNGRARAFVYWSMLAFLLFAAYSLYAPVMSAVRVIRTAEVLNHTTLIYNSTGLYPPAGSVITHFTMSSRLVKYGPGSRLVNEFTATCHGGVDCSHIVFTGEEAHLYANIIGPTPDVRCLLSENTNSSTQCPASLEIFNIANSWFSQGRDGMAMLMQWIRALFHDHWPDASKAAPLTLIAMWWFHQLLWGELHTLYLAPLWEERVKRINFLGVSGFFVYVIIGVELLLHGVQTANDVRGTASALGNALDSSTFAGLVVWGTVMKYWPTAYMHIVAAKMPQDGGIMYHMFWNHVAVGVHRVLAFWWTAWRMGPSSLYVLLSVGHEQFATWRMGSDGAWEPGALAGGFGVYLGAAGIAMAVRAYHKGASSRFPRIDGMGTHSKFRDLVEDPEFETAFPLKESAEFKVRGAGRAGKNRLTQLMPEFVPVASFESNQSNILHSLAGRVLKKTPELSRSTDRLASKLDRMSRKMGYVEPDEPEVWVSKFPAGKRERYLKAFVRLSVFGLACFGRVLLGAHNKWDKRSCFIKHEVNLEQPEVVVELGGSRYHTSCGDPRTIQASTDEVQAVLGRYFTAYGRRAAEVFDGSAGSELDGWRIVAAFGRTKTEVSAITRQLLAEGRSAVVCCGDDAKVVYKGRLFAIDAKRWDAHVGRGLLRLKYRHLTLLGMPDRLAQILQDMIARRGSYKRSGVSFGVDGDVASGDPDTLYWNTMLGVASIIDCFEGASDFEDFNRRAVEYGLEYKLAAVGTVSEPGVFVDFCSCVWTPVLGGLSLVPKLGRALMKSSATATFGNPAKLLAAKMLGLLHDLAAFPEVCRSLAKLLPDLPAGKAASESYVAVGKVEPAPLAEREVFFRERYACEYSDVVDEVDEWVDRSRRGDMAAGDLTLMRRMVEVDYGDKPMASRCGGTLRTGVMFALLLCVSGTFDQGHLCRRVGGPDLNHPEPTLSYQRYITIMPNKGKKNNAKATPALQLTAPIRQARTPRKRTKPGATASGVSGDGLYRLLGPLAKMAVQAAIPAAMGQAARVLRPNAATIHGSGDYVTNDIVHSSNSMPSKKGNAGVPMTKFTHSEYITDLVVPAVPANFSVSRFSINAADTATFPWLSRLASLYTKYKFTKLLFEFRSNTSNYSSAGALGTVVMAPQYNTDAQLFTNKQLMEAATHAVSSAPSNSVLMGFECAKADNINQWYVVLNDNNIARSNLTDMGSIAVATSGLPGTAGTSLGELWVHYTCELIEPYISVTDAVNTGALALCTGFTQTAGTGATFTTGSFGFSNTFMAPQIPAYFSSTPGNYVVATKTSSATLPTGTGWFVSCSGDLGPQLGFRLAGVYEINLKMRLATAPTTTTGAPFDLSANTGSLVSVVGNNSSTTEIVYASPATIITYRWVISVGALTGITASPNAGFTGIVATVVQAVCLTVVKVA